MKWFQTAFFKHLQERLHVRDKKAYLMMLAKKRFVLRLNASRISENWKRKGFQVRFRTLGLSNYVG